jgi:hypothetical protein
MKTNSPTRKEEGAQPLGQAPSLQLILMENIPHNLRGTQALRTDADQKQPYETRPDRANLYPVRNKRQPWQSDLTGVVRLTATGLRYWINVWVNGGCKLRISEQHGSVKSSICQFSPLGEEGRYTGQLTLWDEDSRSQFRLRVWLRETDQQWLAVHFEVVSQRRIEP